MALFVIIDKRKQEIMTKLKFCKIDHLKKLLRVIGEIGILFRDKKGV